MININNETELSTYIMYFKSLDKKDLKYELDIWEDKIKKDSYNIYEFLTFLKILDILESNNTSNIETIKVLNETIEELETLTDHTLDKYIGSDKQKELLDNISKSINECELLLKHYNKRLIT